MLIFKQCHFEKASGVMARGSEGHLLNPVQHKTVAKTVTKSQHGYTFRYITLFRYALSQICPELHAAKHEKQRHTSFRETCGSESRSGHQRHVGAIDEVVCGQWDDVVR
mmetsp:Transcript_108962/g.273050  ORF Transcript_108962/g.273050 Transcript_108962/m.273050 type:complete len:109 (+) Transcript_108962:171-497(+)